MLRLSEPKARHGYAATPQPIAALCVLLPSLCGAPAPSVAQARPRLGDAALDPDAHGSPTHRPIDALAEQLAQPSATGCNLR